MYTSTLAFVCSWYNEEKKNAVVVFTSWIHELHWSAVVKEKKKCIKTQDTETSVGAMVAKKRIRASAHFLWYSIGNEGEEKHHNIIACIQIYKYNYEWLCSVKRQKKRTVCHKTET